MCDPTALVPKKQATRALRSAFAALLALSFSATTSAQTSPPINTTPTPITSTPTPIASATATPSPSPALPTTTPTAIPTVFSSGVPCATGDPSAERVQRSESHGDDDEDDRNSINTGNGSNIVQLHNCTDNRLRVRAAIQLNTIPGRVVNPVNEAYAEGSCTNCQTLAVALQLDLYSAEKARDIEPQNYAIAINTRCTGCVTVARAMQFVEGLEDPRDVAQDISDTIEQLSDELNAIQSDPTVTLAEAESRLNAVMARFNTLGLSLNEQREERDD